MNDDRSMMICILLVLVGHDHHVTVTQFLGIIVLHTVFQTENLLEVTNFGIVQDLLCLRLAHVE